jgi:chemotaxis protein methyltransferase CheR
MVGDIDNQNIELQLLLQAIYLKYGYDFRHYAKASIRRRVEQFMKKENLINFAEAQHKALYEVSFFERLLLELSINVTEMFRDPTFYRSFRQNVVPFLKQQPFLKIWHAGCASGEEVYSIAILLKEEGLYHKTQIYATDMNQVVLNQAKEGIYPLNRLKLYTENYQKAGGKESFSDYYTAHYDHVVMNKSLKENILFSDHNLATDGVFGEMHVIFCRNVLIYFNRELQNRALGLFNDSLINRGILCLGNKESIRFSEHSNLFVDIDKDEKIYAKKISL